MLTSQGRGVGIPRQRGGQVEIDLNPPPGTTFSLRTFPFLSDEAPPQKNGDEVCQMCTIL